MSCFIMLHHVTSRGQALGATIEPSHVMEEPLTTIDNGYESYDVHYGVAIEIVKTARQPSLRNMETIDNHAHRTRQLQ